MWIWPFYPWTAETEAWPPHIFGSLNNSVLLMWDKTYLCAIAGSLTMARCYQRHGANRHLSVKKICMRNNWKVTANGKWQPWNQQYCGAALLLCNPLLTRNASASSRYGSSHIWTPDTSLLLIFSFMCIDAQWQSDSNQTALFRNVRFPKRWHLKCLAMVIGGFAHS